MAEKDRDQTISSHASAVDQGAPRDTTTGGNAARRVSASASLTSVPIAECLEHDRVRVTGTVSSVRALSRRGWPRLEVSLTDGSASVALVWLGRRAISGVEQGHRLSATGTLLRRSGRRVIYNPAYELIDDEGLSRRHG